MADTIYALSSGAPPAGIAVLRVSGPEAFAAMRALAGSVPEPRRAVLAALRAPQDGGLLDRALLLAFPGPASATGEDVAEFHLHGGRAVIRAVEAALGTVPGLRAAEPGEFTRRALANGRIDLSEAEGLGDLLAAETESQRRVAVRAVEGAVRRQVEAWSARLLALAARVEAELDHSDEDDVGSAAPLDAVRDAARALAAEIGAVVARPPVERLRDGLRIVLAGPRNAGKSTLLNALVQRDAAIVSPVAGTTRDRIEVPVSRGGVAYLLTDTAGIADATDDPVEAMGIARTHDAIAGADIVLWLDDLAPPDDIPVLLIHSRADQPGREQTPAGRIAVSAVGGNGIETLWEAIAVRSAVLLPPPDLLALNQRQRGLCALAADEIDSAARQSDLLLLAEHLRSARHAFDAVTGRAGVEAMLDALFARFCIGK